LRFTQEVIVNSLKFSLSLASIILVAACAGEETPPPEVPAPPPPPPAAPAPAPAAKELDDGSQAAVNIAEDIRRACGITEAEAKFDFDSARIRQGDAPVLDKLVACFTTGALAGRSMRLVGHADPRGDEEYNLVLGGRRSDSVKGYMVRAGLKDGQAQTTSRGEMDAEGTDDASWARDRRVDVVLAQ
jgi:peptidoglycan-associated lipoprotein